MLARPGGGGRLSYRERVRARDQVKDERMRATRPGGKSVRTARRVRAIARADLLSTRKPGGILSVGSLGSILSIGSIVCIGSAGSLLRRGKEKVETDEM